MQMTILAGVHVRPRVTVGTLLRRPAGLVALLTVMSVGGCTAPASPASEAARGTPSAAASVDGLKGRRAVGVIQQNRRDGAGRSSRVRVEADGTWTCTSCGPKRETTTGELRAGDLETLRGLLADPALEVEMQPGRHGLAACQYQSLTTLFVSLGGIRFTDCPGEQRPPIAAGIVSLLVKATPLETFLV
jgi:hypothetical protein